MRSIGVISVLAMAGVAGAAEFMWTFDGGNLDASTQVGGSVVTDYFDTDTQSKTFFGNTATNPAVPDLFDGPANYLRALPFDNGGAGGYALDYTGVVPNGGSSIYLNNYTLVFDVLIPVLNWTPFFNTDVTHANDADFYVDPNGRVGIGALGYSPAGTVQAGEWYRIGFSRDRTNNTVTYTVNGSVVFTGGAGSISGRFALFADDNLGNDLLIFGEGDTSGNYTNEIYMSAMFFTDRALSVNELSQMGRPSAAGIIIPEPTYLAVIGLAGLAMRRRR